MAAPDMWGLTTFRFKTTPPVVRKSFVALDQALKYWDSHNGKDETHAIHKFYLNAVIQQCNAWIASKQHKINANYTKNLQKRVQAVNSLAGMAWARLRWESFEAKKWQNDLKHRNRAVNPNAKPLEAGYSNERALFLQAKAGRGVKSTTIIEPVGGSFVHQTMDNANTGNTLAAAGYDNLPGNVTAILQKPFATLTPADFENMNAFFGSENLLSGNQTNVHFARKDERIENYMLVAINGQYFKNAALYTSPGPEMYAMDRYGNMMVNSQNIYNATGSQYNHSSLNAGKEVICAGIAYFQNGNCIYLDNDSGHYKPTKLNLHEAVVAMVDEDQADLNGATIKAKTALGAEVFQPYTLIYNNAAAMGVAGNIGYP